MDIPRIKLWLLCPHWLKNSEDDFAASKLGEMESVGEGGGYWRAFAANLRMRNMKNRFR
jgi:hypothetical protein